MALSRITNPFLSSSGAGNASITSPSANTIAFSTTTSERMRIDSSGNIGIGTSSPTTILNVYNATSSILAVDGDTGAQFRVSRYSNDAAGPFFAARKSRGTFASPTAVASGDTVATYQANAYGGTNYRSAGIISVVIDTYTSDTAISSYMAFSTNSGSTAVSEKMRIDSSGNVGIGTSSPAAKVDNTGTFRTTGVTDPASGTGLELSYRSTYGDVLAYNRTSSTFVQLQVRGEPIIFGNSGGERMRIDSSGNLLVGKTATSVGTAGFEANATGMSATNSGAEAANFNRNTSDGTLVIFRRSSSGVGTISVTTTATAYNTSSDYRLKENIQPMQNALATVAQLKPVTYNWKADGSDGQGFIAHELQAVVPHCVTGEKDAVDADGNPVYQGIDTSFLVATLTAAIQEQQAIITALTNRIEALENK